VAGPQALVLSFSERVEPEEAEDLASYTVTPALAFTSATLGGEGQTVVIAVQRQAGGTTYTLTAANIRDEAGNVIAPPDDTASFQGVPPSMDATPPEPLLPPLNERLVRVTEVDLQWSARSGATSYTVDVAYDPTFLAPIPGSPFTVMPTLAGGIPEPTLRLQVPSARTFFWRARADVTTGTLLRSDFDVVGDALHVHCETSGQCLDTGSAGNVTRPYRTIGGALANATLDGIARINVASRDAAAPYDEIVVLADGVSLYGGYDASFDEATRGNVETGIRGESAFAIYGEDISQLTVVDGFRIYGGIDASANLVKLIRADGVILSNDFIDGIESGGSSGGGSRIPVSITSSGNGGGLIPALIGCAIVATDVDGAVVRGVEAIDSQVRIVGSNIEAGLGSESTGVYVSGTLFLLDSSVLSSSADGGSHGVWLDLSPAATKPSRIERSNLRAGPGAGTTASGLLITGGTLQPAPIVVSNTITSGIGALSVGADISRGVFVNNTVTVYDCVGPACRRYALFTQGPADTDIVVANNILFGQGVQTGGACLGVMSSASEPKVPARIEHNLLFDCPSPLVEIRQGSGPAAATTDLTNIADVNNPASYVISGRPAPVSATGNVNDDGAEAYFTNLAGGDWTLDADVTSAIASGGLDASGDLYGAVYTDAAQVQRTCPPPLTDCYSMGAYERD
ncbi:MAG TPA: Ig-like domain-containing protein, partial [Myxococcota bacterium]|nr:Ig-like domain-containing protein [Myxococcota bacterium]